MAGTYEVIHAFEIGKKEIIIGEDKNALLLLDKDLATRTFTAPVIG